MTAGDAGDAALAPFPAGHDADGLGARLAEMDLTLMTAESITGGGIAKTLVAVEGSGSWLLGGIVAYAPRVKYELLEVRPGPLVTAEVATAMARGAARLAKADVAIATTGCAGPEPVEGQAPGTVWIAVAIGDDAQAEKHRFEGEPEDVATSAVETAIAFACRRLDARPAEPS